MMFILLSKINVTDCLTVFLLPILLQCACCISLSTFVSPSTKDKIKQQIFPWVFIQTVEKMIDRLFGSKVTYNIHDNLSYQWISIYIFSNSSGKEGGTTYFQNCSSAHGSRHCREDGTKHVSVGASQITNHKVGMQKSIDASKSDGE